MNANSDDKIKISAEKSWVVGIIVALIVQVFAGVWWAAATSTQLGNIELRIAAIEKRLDLDVADQITKTDRMARIETDDSILSGSIKDINAHLAAIESYLNTQARSAKR